MSTQIVIQNCGDYDLAQLRDEGVMISKPIEEFSQWAWPAPDTGDDVMPDGLRAVRGDRDVCYFIVELPPGVHSVIWREYRGRNDWGPARTVRLAMPYVIISGWWSRNSFLAAAGCYFRNEPITWLEDTLYVAPLPNTGGSHMCGLDAYAYSLPAAVGRLKNALFGKQFNPDGHGNHHMACQDPDINPVTNWEAKTKEDPTFVLRKQWQPSCRVKNALMNSSFSYPYAQRVVLFPDTIIGG